MGANEMQQALLESMQLLGQKAANSTNAAITIKGEIVDVIDLGLRQYAVSYGGTIYKDVYALGDVQYSPSTIVYILIPDGNFDEPKTILRAVSASVTNYEIESESDIYVPLSSNLFGTENSINLKSWEDRTQTLSIDTSNFGMVFQDYLTTYRNFVFSALIKTEIDKDHQAKGNYGLILNLPFKQAGSDGISTQIWKSYIMDISTMPGTPYAFNEYNKVDLYYTVDDTLEYDTSRTPSMLAFTQDFGYTQARSDINYDIHIKNISVKMVDVLSEVDTTGYYLAVVPTEGTYFLNGKYVNKKTLTPVLKVNAKTTDISKWDCYWFVEDSSIDITSEGYYTLGGLGWRCLNKKTNVTYDAEGNKTFQYVTTNRSLEVSDSDVASALRYKCVLTKDSIVVGGSICLKNLNSRIKVLLVSSTGKNTFTENLGNVTLIGRCYYPGLSSNIGLTTQWQRFDKDGNYLDNNFYTINRWNDKVGDYYEFEITYPCSKLEKLNTVNCTFYSTTTLNDSVVQNNLGTASIIITTTKEMTYGVTIDNGDVLYKYDADGDSPMVANYDGPASSKVTTIKPITFRVFKPDGSELDDTEYHYAHYKWSFPKNSMMKLTGSYTSQDDNYYYIEGWGTSSINYTILSTYNKKKNDNSILLQIEIKGNQISESTNPKFLKDGESGTNGTKYAAVLTYQGYAYGERDSSGKIRKLQPVYVAGSGWKIYDIPNNKLIDFNNPTLSPIVYRDGERITSGYNVAWNIFDTTQTNSAFSVANGVITKRVNDWTDTSAVYCSIVECVITITENSRTNSQEVIYAYYPIEITRLLNSSMASKVIPNLDGGFEEVVYASDGTNPQYDNTNPFTCVDNLYNDDQGDYYDYTWSFSNNLKRSGSGTGSSATIKPVTKFDNGLTKNFVKVILSMSASKRAEISSKISQLTTQITNTQNKINFYQHNRTHILDFVQKFSYNFYEGKLNNAKRVLSYRYEMLNYIPKAREVLEELNTYCINNNIRTTDFNYTRYYSSYNSNLNSAHNNLYLLGYSKDLSDITDLSSCTIIVDVDRLTRNYSAAVAQSINSLGTQWNSLIIKYQEDYAKLVQQTGQQYYYQTEYNNLASFDDNLESFVNDTDLSYLIISHDGNDPEQEFVRLKVSLTAIYNKIGNNSSDVISYSAFVDILKQIENELTIYKNTTYQNQYYNNILSELNTTLIDYQNQKASYEAMLLPASSDYIIHIKPIVMTFNRYELSNINGWDGSKLYIDQTNDQYLLAPQVGAGAKKNGLFTGVVMGIKQFNASTTQHIGLFGYSSGIQSFFINAEDGSALFGKSGKGQIITDPSGDKALLYSSNYWTNYNSDYKPSNYADSNKSGSGMLIDLTTPYIHLGSAHDGKIYSGTHTTLGSANDGFYISHDGLSIGTGFTISSIGVSEIIHEGSNLSSWKVKTVSVTQEDGTVTQDQCLISRNETGIFMDSPSSTIVLGSSSGRVYSGNHYNIGSTADGFYLSNQGLSIGTNFTILASGKATITHSDSNVGQWKLTGDGNNQKLASSSNGILLDAPNSRIILGGGNIGEIYSGTHTTLNSTANGFYLSNAGLSIHNTIKISTDDGGKIEVGRLTGNRKWVISGNSDNSFIGYNTTSFNTNSTSVYVGTDGISLGHDKFWVKSDGELMSKSGTIGGWTITDDTLESRGITINSNGNITGSNWEITSGDATFDDLTANGTGEIAGWTINDWGLQSPSNSMMIKADGSMYGPGNNWYITSAGDAHFDEIYASTKGTVGGWTIGSSSLSNALSGLTLGINGLTGPGFSVTQNGFQGGTAIGSGGTNSQLNWGDNFKVDSNGNLHCENAYVKGEIHANSGEIGGWSIDSSGLTAGEGTTYVKPTGIHTPGLTVDGNINITVEGISKTLQEFITGINQHLNDIDSKMNGAYGNLQSQNVSGTASLTTGTVVAKVDNGTVNIHWGS